MYEGRVMIAGLKYLLSLNSSAFVSAAEGSIEMLRIEESDSRTWFV